MKILLLRCSVCNLIIDYKINHLKTTHKKIEKCSEAHKKTFYVVMILVLKMKKKVMKKAETIANMLITDCIAHIVACVGHTALF